MSPSYSSGPIKTVKEISTSRVLGLAFLTVQAFVGIGAGWCGIHMWRAAKPSGTTIFDVPAGELYCANTEIFDSAFLTHKALAAVLIVIGGFVAYSAVGMVLRRAE